MMFQKKNLLMAAVVTMACLLPGCAGESSGTEITGSSGGPLGTEITGSGGISDTERTDDSIEPSNIEPEDRESERIAALWQRIYDQAVRTDMQNDGETVRGMVALLGANGYAAVDRENQINMAGAEQVLEFCRAVDEKEEANQIILVVGSSEELIRYDLRTEDGSVDIVKQYYRYKDGDLQKMSTDEFHADVWKYTEEGYLFFEGSCFSESYYVLLLSDMKEQAALRVWPLDETCRELNRRYLLPVGYGTNNLFLTDWNEEDFGNLDFYDLFECFYPMVYRNAFPYVMDEHPGVGAVYRVAEDVIENVVQSYINISGENLRLRTDYHPEDRTYEYRPRGFYEAEYPDLPYPEVVNYEEHPDGTISLTVNAVYPYENTSRLFSHEVVVRPCGGRFQYVSNQMVSSKEEDIWWHSARLTKEEWKEIYENQKE